MSLSPVPCGVWTTEEQVRACCSGLPYNADIESAIRFSSAILYRLSGHRWPGVCERTVLPPCKGSCRCSGLVGTDIMMGWQYHWAVGGFPSLPGRVDGGYVNCWHCGRSSCDGACSLDCIELPSVIDSVIEVNIGGEVLDPSAYVIQGHRRLCRVDGGHWPTTNNLAGPGCADTPLTLSYSVVTGEDEEGTWTLIADGDSYNIPPGVSAADLETALSDTFAEHVGVTEVDGDFIVEIDVVGYGSIPPMSIATTNLTSEDSAVVQTTLTEGCIGVEDSWFVRYNYGALPPIDGQLVAAKFSCEVGKEMCGGESCLPQRLKTLTREGVQVAFADPLSFLDKGQVGIYEVDLWLESVNPARIRRRARVVSPRAPRPGRSIR